MTCTIDRSLVICQRFVLVPPLYVSVIFCYYLRSFWLQEGLGMERCLLRIIIFLLAVYLHLPMSTIRRVLLGFFVRQSMIKDTAFLNYYTCTDKATQWSLCLEGFILLCEQCLETRLYLPVIRILRSFLFSWLLIIGSFQLVDL